MENANLILCAVTAAALDICALVLIFAAYREKSTAKKRWARISSNMELVEPGATYPLGCDEVLIGRHASADIRIPDLSVSRYHAMMTVSDGVWTIKDMGSRSGVYVNGVLVKEAKLRENDIINLGSRRLIFRRRRDKHEK
ncbi:MAG: FHA domain-containing protein [Ruminococcus sp.]|nr:FHA domain-containing protein [Ruminococcus sp.]